MAGVDFLVSAKSVQAAIFAAALRSGRPVDELARLVHVPPALLADPDARLSHSRVVTVWSVLSRELDEPALGLLAAQLIDTAAHDRLHAVFSQAPTLGAAMQAFVRYQRLYHTGNESRSELDTGSWRLVFALHRDAQPCTELTEFVLGNWVRRMRRVAGVPFEIQHTSLRRARPSSTGLHFELFGENVRFEAAEDALHLASGTAALPIAGANPALQSILEQQALTELDTVDPSRLFLVETRAALESALLDGTTSIEGLARKLAVSPRTLQRRLAASGTSFQSVLSEVRHTLAVRHLQSGHSVTDTAFLLGFSELSAFSRAFRRWTGHAPRVARAAGAAWAEALGQLELHPSRRVGNHHV